MLVQECPYCEDANVFGAKFCSHCGSPLHLKPCRQCGKVADADAKSCQACGTQFAERPVVSVEPPSTADDIAFGDFAGFGGISGFADEPPAMGSSRPGAERMADGMAGLRSESRDAGSPRMAERFTAFADQQPTLGATFLVPNESRPLIVPVTRHLQPVAPRNAAGLVVGGVALGAVAIAAYLFAAHRPRPPVAPISAPTQLPAAKPAAARADGTLAPSAVQAAPVATGAALAPATAGAVSAPASGVPPQVITPAPTADNPADPVIQPAARAPLAVSRSTPAARAAALGVAAGMSSSARANAEAARAGICNESVAALGLCTPTPRKEGE